MPNDSPKPLSASELASMGGKARAELLTPEKRSEIARAAIEARWQKQGKLKNKMPTVLYGDLGRPLRVGELSIPCFVLDDQRRVLTLKGMVTALGMKKGSGEGGEGGNRLARFSTGKAIKDYIPPGVRDALINPLTFPLPVSGEIAYGFEATILIDICDAVLRARRDKALMPHQAHIAIQCEILLRAFAKTGIIALVDEATGFQLVRAQTALAEILEKFISDELRQWVKTFPLAYFRELCRLRGVPFNSEMRFPSYFGHLTNDVIYSRLAPGVLKKLREKTPVQNGRRKNKLFQWLSEDIGHPKLLTHLGSVVTLMKLANSWDEFESNLNVLHPKYDGKQLHLFDEVE